MGGRWNSPGVRVVYASSSVALAVLEVLAYRKAAKPLSPHYLYSVIVADAQIEWLEPSELPKNWRDYPYPDTTQRNGDAFVEAQESLALVVPSVLVPKEHNVVLNCAHPEFATLAIGEREDFPINPRLTPDVD